MTGVGGRETSGELREVIGHQGRLTASSASICQTYRVNFYPCSTSTGL